ncbi:DUF4229 domain-containing protein [Nocardiopsis trehalosi]|jgi:hypothetical protein|uniref:DUF4229 domain-containing protein n=1 Tax=Nocardiopsis trehalosi TaxID=109329 RepID=UPI000831ADF2|nr:DUF4229 domain-containing protein [Nocardiopsis trehalosi]
MRSVLAYTAARLLLFAVAFGVVYLLGARAFLALALAFLISGMVSYVLLSSQRDAMSAAVAGGLARMRGVGARLEAGAAKEDAAQGDRGAAPADAPDAPDGAPAPEGGPAAAATAPSAPAAAEDGAHPRS